MIGQRLGDQMSRAKSHWCNDSKDNHAKCGGQVHEFNGKFGDESLSLDGSKFAVSPCWCNCHDGTRYQPNK